MKTIAKVIESMLTKDATQQWTGQTSAVASDNWGRGGFFLRQLGLGRLIRRDRQPSRSSPAFSARPKVGWVG